MSRLDPFQKNAMLRVLRALLLAAPILVACAPAAEPVDAYAEEIAQWRAERLERLRSDSGWLTVVGLYWLEPGDNRFGTDPSNDIVLPEGSVPPFAGKFVLDSGQVRVVARPGTGLALQGSPVTERVLLADTSGKPDVLRLGSLSLYVIGRGERYGIRAKDSESAARKSFLGIDAFPADPVYRVRAKFVPYDPPKEVEIPTVLGTVETMLAPGYVTFRLHERDLTLEPVVEEPTDPQLFFIFRDETSGKETYPGGRFLYAERPEDGVVTLDFNRAYNPPCAFTPFATCPLPPPQNSLPVRIEAGEKKSGHSAFSSKSSR